MPTTRMAALLLGVFITFGRTEAQDATILLPGAVLERVCAGGEFTEGPAAGPDGAIYFSDLTFAPSGPVCDGHIWRYDPGSGECRIFRSPSGMSNGIEFDAEGRMVLAQGSDFGGRGLVRTDLRTGKSEVLVSMYNGRPLNSPNDLAIDSRGRIYFTDPRYGSTATVQQPVMGVYRREAAGEVRLIVSDLPMPNGIALAPDERTLYVGSFDEGSEDGRRAPSGCIKAYGFSPGGEIESDATIVAFPPGCGPDGMTTDSSGFLYVAVRGEDVPRIGVYDSTGREVLRIPVPEVPSNVAFARGPEDGTLYITAGGSLYRIRTARRGFFAARW